MNNNRRMFWDSTLALWLECKILSFQSWFMDKRYPIDLWSKDVMLDKKTQ